MIDLNNEEEQRERNYGPVPAGSRVLVGLELQRPRYPAPHDPMIARSQKGLLQLFCKFRVVAGTYEGCSWYENLTLPASSQQIQLDDKQRLSAKIGGSLIRAIIEANRGVNPKAVDERAARARRINAWQELNGMTFPARVGIDKRPYEASDGKLFWNNRIASVVTMTSNEYRELMAGGEFISDGPVTGDPARVPESSVRSKSQSPDYWENPLASAPNNHEYDDVPF